MKTYEIILLEKELIKKTLVQEVQFKQWLRYLFYLNEKLKIKHDEVYQDAFYVKFQESISEGLRYAVKVCNGLKKGTNVEKTQWYFKLIEGLNKIKGDLDDSESLYIEYRRHSSSHIFQNQYEFIQDDYKIKKNRKGRSLGDIDRLLKGLLLKHGSDKRIDEYLNNKLGPELTKLYEVLKNHHSKNNIK